jgi:hypothetical protein
MTLSTPNLPLYGKAGDHLEQNGRKVCEVVLDMSQRAMVAFQLPSPWQIKRHGGLS